MAKPSCATVLTIDDDLSEVRDGLARVRAVADLMHQAAVDESFDQETFEGAADSICREADRLRELLTEAREKLAAIKAQSVEASGPRLEVVRD